MNIYDIYIYIEREREREKMILLKNTIDFNQIKQRDTKL